VPPRPRTAVPVPLARVWEFLGADAGDAPDIAVTGVSLRSAAVRAGDLYAALPGHRTHGARFLSAAVDAGAVAVLTDPEGAAIAGTAGVPVTVVDDPRGVLGELSALVYGRPADALTLVGVTGTQGKTTTTLLVSAGLSASGRRTAVIGSMGTRVNGTPVESTLTTPEAPDLHALLAVMREEGVQVCAMEVSSHALVMGRVDGVVFDLAAFTNFGRDHLDFHGDVEAYFAAKAGLFTPARTSRALLNADDPNVARLLDRPQVPTATFSPVGGAADWAATNVRSAATGSSFVLTGPGGLEIATSVPLAGRFNVANALCALAAIGEVGLDVRAAAKAMPSYAVVPGRMQRVERGQPFMVVVDYAHKPDAVTATLEALRPLTPGRLTIVLGAGGDRDRGKRPIMGEIAARLADTVIVTDDNPRSEDPATIRRELIGGVGADAAASVVEIPDRRRAIEHALRNAVDGDTVLIAGKGHETGQEIAGEVYPFDDTAVATGVLDRLYTGGPGGPIASGDPAASTTAAGGQVGEAGAAGQGGGR
jgi:UDP-N-acetylmuramoyl-L-alanyl-D-glutamate--2,6-diaminopimelate ligase